MNRLNNTILLISLLMTFSLGSCKDEEIIFSKADILVINEGNFSSADGSISSIELTNNTTGIELFQKASGFPLAGIIQNVINRNGSYYIVTNSSDKIEITDNELKSTGTIISNNSIQFASPKDFEVIGSKGYVSNWGTYNPDTFAYEGSFIAVIDLSDNSLLEKIDRIDQPQDLLEINDKLYITNVSTNTISVIDSQTNMEIETIDVPFGPDKMLLDKDTKLWVVCTSGYLIQIDPVTNSVIKSISDIQTQGFDEKITINETGDKLYYLSYDFSTASGAVYEMEINATTAPINPIIITENSYGIGIQDGFVYVGNHQGFVGNGKIEQFNLLGDLINTFDAGRNPKGFIFIN